MPDAKWKKHYDKIIDILTSKYPKTIKKFLLKYNLFWLKFLVYPFYLLLKLFLLLLPRDHHDNKKNEEHSIFGHKE
jgi:hypothetical protein